MRGEKKLAKSACFAVVCAKQKEKVGRLTESRIFLEPSYQQQRKEISQRLLILSFSSLVSSYSSKS